MQDTATGLVYLRARHYHPVLGRFLQRDSFAGFQQRPQSLNRYAYTENNPVNHRDPSGHFIDTLLDVGFIVYDIHRIIQDNILRDCDNLGENVLSLVLDVGGMLVPFVTGAGMAGRAASHADDLGDLLRHADDLPGISRFADDAVRRVDDVADSTRYGDDVAKNADCLVNSFSADTPVMTDKGEVPISEIEVGDLVLAYNEETGETGYYTVTAVMVHIDPTIVHLTIDGETIETTPEHPFYVMDSAPWLQTGETGGRWVDAGDLHVGDAVRQADGTTGMVQAVVVVQRSQPMYNLTVAVAHTFFVGEQQWLVHNCSKYDRPSRFRKNVRDDVWNDAVGPDGQVRDPLTGDIMNKDKPWDMGHKSGYEFRKHRQSAEDRGISRKQFLDEHNDPTHYQPELPSSNRSHRGEDLTDDYFGP